MNTLLSVPVRKVVAVEYSGYPTYHEKVKVTTRHIEHHPTATYVTIFGPSQKEYLEKLKESKKFNIVFEGPPAVNGRKGHGTAPRNTLVIYELADEQVPKV